MLGGRARTANLARVPTLSTRHVRIAPNSAEHRAIKRAVAKRSRGWCECTQCQQSRAPLPAQEFDHRIPLWEGGTNDLGNWQHLNAECHKHKSKAEERRRLGLD